MDISDIVNWGTLIIWTIGGILYMVRVATGEQKLHPRLKRFLSSNVLLGLIILAGFVLSATERYPIVARYFGWQSITVTVSAYNAGNDNPMEIVSGQTFENADVPLDGHSYNDCAFINSCLLYYGGPYQLQNVTFKKHWRVCVKDPSALYNYSSLLYALDPIKPSQLFHKTLVIPRR